MSLDLKQYMTELFKAKFSIKEIALETGLYEFEVVNLINWHGLRKPASHFNEKQRRVGME